MVAGDAAGDMAWPSPGGGVAGGDGGAPPPSRPPRAWPIFLFVFQPVYTVFSLMAERALGNAVMA